MYLVNANFPGQVTKSTKAKSTNLTIYALPETQVLVEIDEVYGIRDS